MTGVWTLNFWWKGIIGLNRAHPRVLITQRSQLRFPERKFFQTLNQAILTITDMNDEPFFVARNVCKTSIKSFCFSGLASSNEMMMNLEQHLIRDHFWELPPRLEDALLFLLYSWRDDKMMGGSSLLFHSLGSFLTLHFTLLTFGHTSLKP